MGETYITSDFSNHAKPSSKQSSAETTICILRFILPILSVSFTLLVGKGQEQVTQRANKIIKKQKTGAAFWAAPSIL